MELKYKQHSNYFNYYLTKNLNFQGYSNFHFIPHNFSILQNMAKFIAEVREES